MGAPKDPSQWDYKCLGGKGVKAKFDENERDLPGPNCYGKGGGGFFFSFTLEAESKITFAHDVQDEDQVGKLEGVVEVFRQELQAIDDHIKRVTHRTMPPGRWVEAPRKRDLKVGDVLTAGLAREIIISDKKDGKAHLVYAFTCMDSGPYVYQANVPGKPSKDAFATVTKINTRGVFVELDGLPCKLASMGQYGRGITHGWTQRVAEEPAPTVEKIHESSLITLLSSQTGDPIVGVGSIVEDSQGRVWEILDLHGGFAAVKPSTKKESLLRIFKSWVQSLDAHRASFKQALDRGAGPCPGGSSDKDLICDVCVEYADSGAKLGDACKNGSCPGFYAYKYDPESTEHDFDGGECWRCGGLSPSLWGEEDSPLRASSEMDSATFPLSEAMAQELVRILEA